jgi:hypothetical protein
MKFIYRAAIGALALIAAGIAGLHQLFRFDRRCGD